MTVSTKKDNTLLIQTHIQVLHTSKINVYFRDNFDK